MLNVALNRMIASAVSENGCSAPQFAAICRNLGHPSFYYLIVFVSGAYLPVLLIPPRRNQKKYFQGGKGALTPQFRMIVFNRPEKGARVLSSPKIWSCVRQQCRQTAQDGARRTRGARRPRGQDGARRRKTVQKIRQIVNWR